MSVYNRYYIDRKTKKPMPVHLLQVGARLEVEINIPKKLAVVYADKNIPIPRSITGKALVDTGASVTAVDQGEIDNILGLKPTGITKVLTPSGQDDQYVYPISMDFPGAEIPSIDLVSVVGSKLKGQNIIALIGRDILSKFVLIYNGPGAIVTLTT